MKNLNISLLSLLLIMASCGLEKKIIKAPNVNLDPKFELIKKSSKGVDPKVDDQWANTTNGLEKVWKKYFSSASLRVSIVGTGIDYNHPDLQANIERKKVGDDYQVGVDLVDNDKLAYDHYGHDTKLAGVIGGLHSNSIGIKGVLSKVSIVPVRYIDANGRSNVILLHKALLTILNDKPDIALINLPNISLKSDDIDHSGSIKKVLKELMDAKIPLVISAGNFSSDMSTSSKLRKLFSKFTNIVVVTAHNKELKKSDLSNYSSSSVHTSAPGHKIMTTLKGGAYGFATGTDLAAAYVVSALGLAISEFRNKHELMVLIQALMMDESSDVNNDMRSYTLGRNNLNILKYLDFLAK